MKILGIDPALHKTGFALLHINDGKTIVEELTQFIIKPRLSMGERLSLFKEELEQFNTCDAIALETPFLGKNAQTFLKLGYIRGIILTFAFEKDIPVYEYTPQQIKQSITRHRYAPKDQVARVLYQLFPKLPKNISDDETDALAAALMCSWKEKI